MRFCAYSAYSVPLLTLLVLLCNPHMHCAPNISCTVSQVVQSLKKGRDCCPRKDVVWQLVLTKTQVASLRTQNPTLLRSFFKAKELNLAHEALKEETSYKKAGTNEENETWKTAKKV